MIQEYKNNGLNQTYMNFVAHQRLGGQPVKVFQDLHQYVLDCSQILDNHDPMVSPPRQAHISDFLLSDSNSDDEVAMLSAFLGNLGCNNNMLCCFEFFFRPTATKSTK